VNLGSWWAWYNHTPNDQLLQNADATFWPVVSRERVGDGSVSIRLWSGGYETEYRSREFGTLTQRPALVVGYLPGTMLTLEPVADAYVDASATPHGTETHLDVDGTGPERVFLRFDVSSIPAGAVIASVTLTMTSFEGTDRGGDGTVSTHFVTDDTWSETAISGTTQPAADASALGAWVLSYASGPAVRTARLSSEALRQAVVSERAGDGRISLRLESAVDQTHYRSREVGTPGQRPQLTIQYAVP
jgi:hypothetical protein